MTLQTVQRLLVPPQTPSILGAEVTRVPLAPISLWPIGTVCSAHVLPKLDLTRLQTAISELARLYPVLGGRFSRTDSHNGAGYDYWVTCGVAPSPQYLELTFSDDRSTSPALASLSTSALPSPPHLPFPHHPSFSPLSLLTPTRSMSLNSMPPPTPRKEHSSASR